MTQRPQPHLGIVAAGELFGPPPSFHTQQPRLPSHDPTGGREGGREKETGQDKLK